ncbi:hypothetical protein GCM10010371_68840 [Streptomyces subrutilus]|uniref:Uncharacterized protein n=1 Tax=Streptomyces subrutilus TaxID=36818 RepID=A0A918VHQ4_9ACTN|nr:hypothetical protein GCM10010371_68840 [Streptomyces subrutilus]
MGTAELMTVRIDQNDGWRQEVPRPDTPCPGNKDEPRLADADRAGAVARGPEPLRR